MLVYDKMKNLKNIPINYLRAIIIAEAIFLGLFSLDTGLGIGLLMHLSPSIIILGTLILTWKKPKLAGIFFSIEGIITLLFFNTYTNLFSFLTISLPLILVGILFYLKK